MKNTTKFKFRQPWLIMLLCMFVGLGVFAQTGSGVKAPSTTPITIQLGQPVNNAFSHPYFTIYMDNHSEILYTAAEITAAGGVAGDITGYAFNVVETNSFPMNNFTVGIQNYSSSTLTSMVTSGFTTVYSGTYAVPGTGWQTVNFTTPFVWDGVSNVLISTCFDNTAYSGSTSIYSETVPNMMWEEYSDTGSGCSFIDGSAKTERPNIRLFLEPEINLPTGTIQGFITNAYGVPMSGATVVAQGEYEDYTATSEPNGSYILSDVFIGSYTLSAGKAGFNISTIEGLVVAEATTTYQNFSLTQPSMAITPNPYTVNLNPNEYLDGALSIVNNGSGPLAWNAEIVFPEDAPAHQYPDYLTVRGNLPEVNEPVSAGIAPHAAPYATDNNMQMRDPGDLAYCYVASVGSSSLDKGPGSFILNAPGTITRFGSAVTGTNAFIMAADWANDTWYGVNYAGNNFLTIDPVTGAYTAIGTTGAFVGISYNAQNELMYGLALDGTLQTINLATGATTNVGSAGISGFIAFEIDNDGIGYAVNVTTDEFGTINLATGAWTSLAPLGFNANYAQDMSCDPSTNEIY
ncbi:MAG: carboxypeptidase regulatory-like domain-containing protein, partial [Lentimicrobiaceae bacterium]